MRTTTPDNHQTLTPITLGVSACLMGKKVRFDGGHKRAGFIADVLPQYFSLIALCPETAIGLNVPREPIRLIKRGDTVRAVGVKNDTLDVTDRLRNYGHNTADRQRALSGFIFKKGSPSCGMERVKLYHANGHPASHAQGLFANTLMTRLPLMPCEEEGRLNDPRLRESFFKRVFVYHQWQQLENNGLTPAALIQFHTEHKFTLLAHNETGYRELGRLVAGVTTSSIVTIAPRYIKKVMATLKRPATRKRHCNVLMHMAGFLKEKLQPDDKRELLTTIETYARGHIPLIVPITLINHHQRQHRDNYLAGQRYLQPYPSALQLGNAV